MLVITPTVCIPDHELEWHAVRAQGAGGQNVNKVASAVHLRFDIAGSSLPESCKARLLALHDHRISREGVLVIKAQRYRSQDKNREDALARLAELVRAALLERRLRRPTVPSRAARRQRTDRKVLHGRTKALRGKVPLS